MCAAGSVSPHVHVELMCTGNPWEEQCKAFKLPVVTYFVQDSLIVEAMALWSERTDCEPPPDLTITQRLSRPCN